MWFIGDDKKSGASVSPFLPKNQSLFRTWDNLFKLYYGLNLAPTTSYVEVPIPRISECELVWRQGLYRGNQIKLMSEGRP